MCLEIIPRMSQALTGWLASTTFVLRGHVYRGSCKMRRTRSSGTSICDSGRYSSHQLPADLSVAGFPSPRHPSSASIRHRVSLGLPVGGVTFPAFISCCLSLAPPHPLYTLSEGNTQKGASALEGGSSGPLDRHNGLWRAKKQLPESA